MISLTKIAARNFKRIREDEELSEHIPLRVAVKGGGCAGYEYILTFGDVTNSKDLVFESEGMPIVIDRKSHLVVDGLEIDWSTDLSAPGPRFQNPKATSTCGCSTSFAITQKFETPSWIQ